jgi:hypothetical protein
MNLAPYAGRSFLRQLKKQEESYRTCSPSFAITEAEGTGLFGVYIIIHIND